jgi:CRISPR-associated protein Cas1
MTVEGIFLPSADTEQGAGVHRRVDQPSAMSPHVDANGKMPDVDLSNPPQKDVPSQSSEDTSVPSQSNTSNSPRKRVTKLEEDVDGAGDAQRPRSIRSLALTSERLGVTATLDLAEIDGQRAVPVEYRKGRPRHNTLVGESGAGDEMMDGPPVLHVPEPWPTDRVQLGLQVLLLEEAGYSVPEAYLYYAAEKLRLRVEVNDALRTDALATLDAARQAAAGSRPAPLLNDPKCPKCSLQPICLPDEVNHQRLTAGTGEANATSETNATGTSPDATPRKLWPPRDDGIHAVLQRDGVRVGVRGQSVKITDKDGATAKEFPLANLESLAVLGGVQVSTQALTVFAEHQVPVAFLSSAGRLVAMMDPMGPTSATVRAAQVRVLDKPGKALELARAITVAKIANQRTLLMRNHANLPSRAAGDLQYCVEQAARDGRLAWFRMSSVR